MEGNSDDEIYLPQHFGEKQLTGLNTGTGRLFAAPSSDPLILALLSLA